MASTAAHASLQRLAGLRAHHIANISMVYLLLVLALAVIAGSGS